MLVNKQINLEKSLFLLSVQNHRLQTLGTPLPADGYYLWPITKTPVEIFALFRYVEAQGGLKAVQKNAVNWIEVAKRCLGLGNLKEGELVGFVSAKEIRKSSLYASKVWSDCFEEYLKFTEEVKKPRGTINVGIATVQKRPAWELELSSGDEEARELKKAKFDVKKIAQGADPQVQAYLQQARLTPAEFALNERWFGEVW